MLILGCLLLGLAVWLIARMDGATLGPYSTRLLGITVVCAGYYGMVRWLRFGHGLNAALRWQFPRYLVPIAAGAGALYCVWRVLQTWRTEVHGLVKTVLTLVLLLLLGAVAWLCFAR